MTTEEFIAHATTHPEDLDALFSHIRKTKIREHRFDFNYALAEGRQAEKLVNEILSGGKTVEVKLDNRVSDTGRILIEYAHQYGETSVLSGITTSEADWYAFVFGGEKYRQEVVVMVRRHRLKDLLNAYGKSNAKSGIPGNSNFLLINKEDLLAMDF